jgi:hypothetical protein
MTQEQMKALIKNILNLMPWINTKVLMAIQH